MLNCTPSHVIVPASSEIRVSMAITMASPPYLCYPTVRGGFILPSPKSYQRYLDPCVTRRDYCMLSAPVRIRELAVTQLILLTILNVAFLFVDRYRYSEELRDSLKARILTGAGNMQ
ncbi:hypothetical protein K491DRAFT_487462 [Lophiostoma macrostomum CBS 122681]|uniref:Uncharacterized protein n=1 Tax=Lophiostoma macrostomum CBS 122681 TaxID=1314788 RepID=A0A6A6T6G9_9PLEO|nr:hypothetical protein K491DRAFT_487462 [Lophiostoma macrostomum CBS 122681]